MYTLERCGFHDANGTEVPLMLITADGEDRIDDIDFQLYKSESDTPHVYVGIGDDSFVLDHEYSKKLLDQLIKCRCVLVVCQYTNLANKFYREIGAKPSPDEDDEAALMKETIKLSPEAIGWFKQMREMMRDGGGGGEGTSAAD